MKINVHDFETALLQRFPKLDKDGNGKVDIADVRSAIADARNQFIVDTTALKDQMAQHPVVAAAKLLGIGAACGGVVGLVIGATTLAKLFH